MATLVKVASEEIQSNNFGDIPNRDFDKSIVSSSMGVPGRM
jgi:hypothetical protein